LLLVSLCDPPARWPGRPGKPHPGGRSRLEWNVVAPDPAGSLIGRRWPVPCGHRTGIRPPRAKRAGTDRGNGAAHLASGGLYLLMTTRKLISANCHVAPDQQRLQGWPQATSDRAGVTWSRPPHTHRSAPPLPADATRNW